jgi:hypothetical protein
MLLRPKQALYLAELLWPAYIREGDATFVAALRTEVKAALTSFKSPLEAELFVNHVHVLDLLKHSASLPEDPWWNAAHADFIVACRIGVLLCESWTAKLGRDFPDEDFAVFYTRDDNPVVRFHRIRDDGRLWFDPMQASPRFEEGAVLLLTSQSGRRVGAG